MIEKEKLKDYANKLMFDMDDSEYSVLQDEFETIFQKIPKNEGGEDVIA